MRSSSFLLLYFCWLLTLFGLRVGLERWLDADARPVSLPGEEQAMAVPPKPQGAQAPPSGAQEGEGGRTLRLDRAYCEARSADVRDICLQALARQMVPADVPGARTACAAIVDPELGQECLADVAETLAPHDRAGAEAICAEVSTLKWKGQCHFGLGLAVAEIDPSYAMGRCEYAEAFRLFCRHDVVGEIALVNIDAAISACRQEEGSELARKTCWHGIGKYLARRDPTEASVACEQTTLSWRGNCYHGLGWGAAERDPDATLAFCAGLAGYADNCRQGVAHQLKRGDPTRAIALCESIQTESVRTRCLDFVTR